MLLTEGRALWDAGREGMLLNFKKMRYFNTWTKLGNDSTYLFNLVVRPVPLGSDCDFAGFS